MADFDHNMDIDMNMALAALPPDDLEAFMAHLMLSQPDFTAASQVSDPALNTWDIGLGTQAPSAFAPPVECPQHVRDFLNAEQLTIETAWTTAGEPRYVLSSLGGSDLTIRLTTRDGTQRMRGVPRMSMRHQGGDSYYFSGAITWTHEGSGQLLPDDAEGLSAFKLRLSLRLCDEHFAAQLQRNVLGGNINKAQSLWVGRCIVEAAHYPDEGRAWRADIVMEPAASSAH